MWPSILPGCLVALNGNNSITTVFLKHVHPHPVGQKRDIGPHLVSQPVPCIYGKGESALVADYGLCRPPLLRCNLDGWCGPKDVACFPLSI